MEVRYDVALSYAGEDRAHAVALAARLQRAGLRVFFDRFEEMWGQDLSVRLHEVYDRQCRHAVVFVSAHYLRQPWTNYERRVLVARGMREERFLLPIRLDDTELPGLPGVVAYKDARLESVEAIADALRGLLASAPRPLQTPVGLSPSDFLYVVADPYKPDRIAFNLGCLVSNSSDRTRALRHVEAWVRPTGQSALQFQWNGFYALSGWGMMFGLDRALPLALEPGQSELVGICFVGPPLAPALAWPEGTLDVELAAWVDVAPRRAEPDLRTTFAALMSPDALTAIAPWFAAKKALGLSVAGAVPLAVNPSP